MKTEPVTSWQPPEAAYNNGNREWLPTTEAFYDDMLCVLPPCEVSRSQTHGFSFAVSEAWKHVSENGKAQPVFLFFRDRPDYACRMATGLEMHQEIFPMALDNGRKVVAA